MTNNSWHLETEVDVTIGGANAEFEQMLVRSKRIQLPYSLVADGIVNGPPAGDWTLLQKVFPKALTIELRSPYMIIRVSELPPKPWPLTVGDLPFHYTTAENGEVFKRGAIARGPMALTDLNLHGSTKFSKDVLLTVARYFTEKGPKIRDLYWFPGFWQITTVDQVDPKSLPWRIAGAPLFFRTVAENPDPDPDPAALRKKIPAGTEYDDTDYAVAENALLRPGLMLGSSFIAEIRGGETERNFMSTTSGILVADVTGDIFITVSSQGFNEDGLVYHPNPATGKIIGRIVTELPETGISLAKLNKGLRYTNETFGSPGLLPITITKTAPPYPPQTKLFDPLSINSPYSGQCDGSLLAVGVRVGRSSDKLILHVLACLENSHEPISGSCGCPVIDSTGRVLGLCRFVKKEEEGECLCVAAEEVGRFGYEIYSGERTF